MPNMARWSEDAGAALEARDLVLHAFQKKSKSGIATPKADIERITRRLKQAVAVSKGQKKE